MSESTLIAHCGARHVTRAELDEASKLTPPPTSTWYPIAHNVVIDRVGEAMHAAGFTVRATKFAVTRHAARMFATLDTATNLNGGSVKLAVAVVNSIDKSLPMKLVAGSRVLVCDNMSLRSDVMAPLARKHTRFGLQRFTEQLAIAVRSLEQFRVAERNRIDHFKRFEVSNTEAEAFMLRAYEQEVVSHRLLPRVIEQWRNPSFDEFKPRTLWSLENAFTTVLGDVVKANPQRFVGLSMGLQTLLGKVAGPVQELQMSA